MSNYDIGRKFEGRVKRHYESEGWFVIRSAGSHSLIDLVALRSGEVVLIQCKTDGVLSPLEREQLRTLASVSLCQVVMISREGRRMVSEDIKEEKQ